MLALSTRIQLSIKVGTSENRNNRLCLTAPVWQFTFNYEAHKILQPQTHYTTSMLEPSKTISYTDKMTCTNLTTDIIYQWSSYNTTFNLPIKCTTLDMHKHL